MRCFVALVVDDVAMENWILDVPWWPRVGDVLNFEGRKFSVVRVEHDFAARNQVGTIPYNSTFVAVTEEAVVR